MYKQVKMTGIIIDMVERIEDHVFIPFDPANTDYQAYLRWLEEGNTVLPAEENQ